MVQMDDAFLKKLLAAFAIEAHEHIEEINEGLRELKTADEIERPEWLEKVFRATHSLKGAARAVNKLNVESICQNAESFFAILQRDQKAPTDIARNVLFKAVDLIEKDLDDPDATSDEEIEKVRALLSQLVRNEPLEDIPYAAPPAPQPSITAPPSPVEPEPAPAASAAPAASPAASTAKRTETLRVPIERLEKLMRESEELLTLKLSAEHRVEELNQVADQLLSWKRMWSEVNPLIRQLTQLASKPITNNTQLQNLGEKLRECLETAKEDLDPLELQMALVCQHTQSDASTAARFVDSLHDDMRDLLMVPFSSTLSMMHKIARDLSNEQGKQVELAITGGTVEADRRILEGLKDPLVHILRNSIDHGIELPSERTQHNKPLQGTVAISIDQIDSGKVQILIEDDGRGLNLDRIRSALAEKHGLSPEEIQAMSDEQVAASIFLSGLSTADRVTEISGRGVGMSVVHERVESLGGSVRVSPREPCGTTFTLELPVAVATFRGILIQTAECEFLVPTPAVERMIRIPVDNVKTVENRDTITVAGQVLPIESLAGLLELPPKARSAERTDLIALIICAGSQRFAIEVDHVLREQEVLVKPLGPQLVRVRNISGIAVLGTGELCPILNIHDLVKSSIRGGSRPVTVAAQAAPKKKKKSIMIAEDSITSRMLLKNVLDSAGYDVEVAVDGAAAFAALKMGNFDALVSDVDMPRMNGFVLTERVRADKKLSHIPIILITSLASREDKERGIDAGVSAYIVKSSFDQSNLLEVLDRLLETQ